MYIIYMYYIYHIPGIKIGCTIDYPYRCIKQNYTEYELLETYEDGWIAGDREIELQKQYGYPVDRQHYMKNSKMVLTRSQQCFNLAGAKSGISRRHLNFEQAEEVRSKYIPRKYTAEILAKEYNVSISVIKFIVQNRHKVKKGI